MLPPPQPPTLTAPTPAEYAAKLTAAQVPSPFSLPTSFQLTPFSPKAAGQLAAQHEHAGSYSSAFTFYLQAAQSYLFLLRHTTDPAAKARLREVSKGWVERAERIKAAKKGELKPVGRERLSIGE